MVQKSMEPGRILVVFGPLKLRESLEKLEAGMSNPAIGGTEFQLLSLALALASDDEFDIEVVCTNAIPRGLASKIKLRRLVDVNKFGSNTVLISPVSTISEFHPAHLANCRIILSSHHPHDRLMSKKLRKLPIKLFRVVGAYSYLAVSNQKPACYIPNLFLSKTSFGGDVANKHHITCGNISSYHPSKGTHHVIGMFGLLCAQVRGIRLELVGSSELYANDTEIPRRNLRSFLVQPYKVQIDKLIGRFEVASKECQIREFGLQSTKLAEIVAGWRFAIINPLGIGESDPASIKDCLALEVPVFSTGDFGTWDYQRFFPETTDYSPLQLLDKVVNYINEPELQQEIQSRVRVLTKELTERNLVILETWRKTIRSVISGESTPESHAAVFEPSIISSQMFRRIQLRKILYRFPAYQTLSNFLRDRYWSYRLRSD